MSEYVPTQQERESAEARDALWKALEKPDKLFEIASALTAAEERGRRRGLEEAAVLLDAKIAAQQPFSYYVTDPRGGVSLQQGPHDCLLSARGVATEIRSLAPRDSAPADDYCVTCNSIRGTHQAWCDRKPRDSGKVPTHNERASIHTDKCRAGLYDTECK